MGTGATATILLVEDNPADVRLTREALKDCKEVPELFVAKDGEEAIAFLGRQGKYSSAPRPDLVILDINLPRKNGHEVLAFAKAQVDLKGIPVIILTNSREQPDLIQAYALRANCYINKPMELDGFSQVVKAINQFWFSVAKLPRASQLN